MTKYAQPHDKVPAWESQGFYCKLYNVLYNEAAPILTQPNSFFPFKEFYRIAIIFLRLFCQFKKKL